MDEASFDSSFLVTNEEETGDEGETAKIQGNFPDWVKGTVFTCGPGKFHFKDSGFTVNHFNDGFGIICKLAISDKKITIWKKFVQSDALEKANKAGKTVLAEYYTPSSTDVTKSTFGRMVTLMPEITDNGNHNICFFGDRIYTFNGLEYFIEICPTNLSTGTKYNTNKFGLMGQIPHPLVDYDGSMYNLGSIITATGSKLKVFKFPAVKPGETFKDNMKNIKILATLPSSRVTYASFQHSFGMSENYIVLVNQPLIINAKKLLRSVLTGGAAKFADFNEWHPEEINRFIIVEKSTGKIHKRKIISSEPFFFDHITNCYEENNQLILDLLAFPDISNARRMFLKPMAEGECCNVVPNGTFKRFVLPLAENLQGRFGSEACIGADDTVTVTGLCMSKIGLQHSLTINPKFRFRKYRYAYGNSGFFFQGPYANKITKIDLVTGKESSWEMGEDCIFQEIIFIPNPDGVDEDDGILFSNVATSFRNGGQRYPIFIDAKTMVEVGRAELKNPVALYCHSVFMPSLF